jgi:ribosomal protein S27E
VTNSFDNDPRSAAALAVFCRRCSSPLVQASGWTKAEGSNWRVQLWCPECWHERKVILDRAQASYLSLAVEEGFACLLETFGDIDEMPTTDAGTKYRENPN